MNLLKTIIERLNQRVDVANIFDQIYPLCELNANGNDKAWVHYIGNGQAEVVTNFDAKQGTLFWAKRGKVSVTKTESLKVSGCKTLYLTTFPLTAYAVVRKSHLPCDSEDSQDWIASRIYRLISGTDPDFKVSIGVIQYEVIPNGYVNEIKSLTANYEWACVAVDVDVNVVSSSEDGCYDVCATGDIPLPDFEPCTPCLTEVAVDGVTIIGNGTIGDPLIAIGGGGGGGVMTAIAFSTDHLSSTGNQYVIGNVVWYLGNIYRCIAPNDSILPTNTTYWTNLGAGFQTIERPIDWDATSGNNQILNKPTIPILPATIVEDVTATAPMSSSGGTNPDISITQADGTTDGYLSQTDWNTFDGKFNVPTGLNTDYLDGLGSPQPFPTIPAAQVNSDWNATSGVAEILNKPTIPTGSVTSVDLTMPSAFSVSGNPITTSGTLGVTANGVSTQYIRGDGQLANFPTSTGGGASVSYYLNGSVSQGTFGGIAMKEINKVPVIGAGTDFTINADGYIQSFITDANDPNQLSIPAGNWNFETYFSASSGGGSPKFYIELYKWNGATLTLIASNSATPENITGGTNIDLYLTALAVPQTTLLVTDRLAVRFYVIHSGRTITMHTEDNHLSQIITTFSTGLTSLNGLTAQTQLLAVGTSGTDFAISSTTATHTFNLPTASAANRGALSTADWTTFNGKQNAITLTTTGTSGAATLTGATLNIPQYSGGGGSNYKSTTDTAGYSATANTAVYTQLIAANTYAIGDILRVTYRTRKTGGNGNQTLRIYVNATPDLTGTPILIGGYQNAGAPSFLVNQMVRHLAIKSSTNNTEVYFAAGLGVSTDYGLYNAVTTCAIDWTTNKYFVFAIQPSGAIDVNYGSMYLIEKL
jgi:hypothetical protein